MNAVNVASHLARLAASEPDRPALHYPARGVRPDGPSEHTTFTFAQLNAEADALAHGLALAGVTRGTRTVLMVPPSPEFFGLTFALLKAGAVPVLIDPGMGMKNLRRCLAEAEPEAFIGVRKAHVARRLFGWARKTLKTTINVGPKRFFCHHALDDLRTKGLAKRKFVGPDVSPTEPAAVLFTSGSTGIAKGALYTHGIFSAQVESLKATYGIEPGEVDLCTFPLFALFGPALGMTCVIPDMDFARPATVDRQKIVSQVRQFNVTNLFGSPAVLRQFTDYEIRDADLFMSTLRRVISAGAPVPARTVERFTTLIPPGVEIFTPYGATEALPVANIGSREILEETRHLTDQGKGVCVGRPVAGITVYVVPITDEPIAEWDESKCLPPGEIGEFVVRGPVVTRQYFNRPEATKLAKIKDAKTGDVLHRMGDVGYFDDNGRMWYCGRKSHRVVTPNGTLFTEMVEAVFNSVPGVFRTALVGVTRGGVTYPVVCVEPQKLYPTGVGFGAAWNPDALMNQLHTIKANASHTAVIDAFLIFATANGFPVDVRHNAKIFREKLAVWADKQLGPKWTGAKP